MSKVNKEEFGANLFLDEGQSNNGIALLNQHGCCVYADAAFVALSGFTKDKLYHVPLHELLHLPDLDNFVAAKSGSDLRLEQAEQNLATRSYRLTLHSEDGTPFPAVLHINRALCGKDQSLLLLTLRRLIAAGGEETPAGINEATYSFAAKAAGIGAWEQDLSTNTLMVSAVAAHIIGLPAQETLLTEDQWQQMVWPEDLPLFWEKRENAIQTGEPFSLQYRQIGADGQLIWIASRGALLYDENGSAAKLIGVLIDITSQKKQEEALRRSEERFRLLTEFSPDAILVELNDRFMYANPSAIQIFGVAHADELIGRSIFDFIEPEFHEVIQSRQRLIVEHKQKVPMINIRLRRADGSLLQVQAVHGETVWEGQTAIQMMLRDVTEFLKAQDKLRRLSERLHLAVEGTGEGIWDWDIATRTFTLSGGLKKILGRSDEELVGTESVWHNAIHPDDLQRVSSAFQACIEGRIPVYECEYRLKANDGRWKWVKARGVIVEWDAERKPVTITGTLLDITTRKEAEDLIWRHANLDVLTELPNRRLFRERLEVEIANANRNRSQLALLFIDIDEFKQVNDLYGHDAGDLLLVEAAQRIKACVRKTDLFARLGGDEFTVVLSELDAPDCVQLVCQKILGALAKPFRMRSELVYVSGSIGVSLFPSDAAVSSELLRKADQAMYSAKKAGKNQFSLFTQGMDEKTQRRVRINNELRSALKEKQFTIHYQPVVDLSDGKVIKAEALLRWRHPTLGNVEPSIFIPMAEELGMIEQIGNWVFKEAAKFCKRCTELAGMPFQISVNKSATQFISRGPDANWLQHLSELDIPGSCISIEITEGALLHASPSITDKLLEYRDAGIQVAIDDFGTGYSSMSYLHKFDIDYLKIDQSFVQNITNDTSSRIIAESIIVMAHKLGMKVIAEGIETQEQMGCLIAAGCDYGQGYLFSQPVPMHKLEELLSRQKHGQVNLLQ